MFHVKSSIQLLCPINHSFNYALTPIKPSYELVLAK